MSVNVAGLDGPTIEMNVRHLSSVLAGSDSFDAWDIRDLGVTLIALGVSIVKDHGMSAETLVGVVAGLYEMAQEPRKAD